MDKNGFIGFGSQTLHINVISNGRKQITRCKEKIVVLLFIGVSFINLDVHVLHQITT